MTWYFVCDVLKKGRYAIANALYISNPLLDKMLDKLIKSANTPDKSGYTKAGRSLTKHGGGARPDNRLFPTAKGNVDQINQQALEIVKQILENPNTQKTTHYRGRFGETVEYIAPDGRGIVFDAKGNFLFFRE